MDATGSGAFGVVGRGAGAVVGGRRRAIRGVSIDGRGDPDLARLDSLRFRDAKREHAVFERRLRLVRLEAVRERDHSADAAPADLPDEVLTFAGGLLGIGFAADAERAVLHGDLDVFG